MPLLEFGEGIGDLVKRKRGGDVEIDGAGSDQIGDFGEHVRCRRLGAALGLGADFAGLLKRDDRVDPLGCDTQIYGELDVVRAE